MTDENSSPLSDTSSIVEVLARIENQNVFLQQQMAMLGEDVKTQVALVEQSSNGITKELKRYQTSTGKHVIASVFFKFLRDLIQHMNQLDDLLVTDDDTTLPEVAVAWRDAVDTLRGNFESVLAQWGCVPVVITPGESLFNPNIHVAADSIEADHPSDTIIEVVQRGWQINDQIIQQPHVIVCD